MKFHNQSLSIAPTDLSYFLSCRHRAARELSVAHGARKRPVWDNPVLETLIELGQQHEARYVQRLKESGKSVLDLSDVMNRELSVRKTLEAMEAGVDAIVQAGLSNGSWYGRPDVLLKVPEGSPKLGGWSYEPADAKLARETRGGTIIQLGLYCDLLDEVQGRPPDRFHVVAPGEDGHVTSSYRYHEYGAYFRLIKAKFGQAVALGFDALESIHQAEPVEHCTVCPWWGQCRDWWVETDHLCLVAGISRLQRRELVECGVVTVEALAQVAGSVLSQTKRGNVASYVRVREQARLQVKSRREGRVAYEVIPPEPEANSPVGLARLPEPSPGDVFLDLEGDRLTSDGGRDYLFGLVILDTDGNEHYKCWWADTPGQEVAAFESVVDFLVERLEAFPDLCIYHYAHYEETAFKRLMGKYATRETEVDRLLRGERFVDLYRVVCQGVRVGVEQYSIKNLEELYGFKRGVELRDATRARRLLEQALELKRFELITLELRETVRVYNKDDCVSTRRLRDWLEALRTELVQGGHQIERPELLSGEASEKVDEKARVVEAIRSALLMGQPDDPQERSGGQQADYQLAYLLDWHRRESNVGYWEYFRLLSLPHEELLDERKAVAGLKFVGNGETVKKSVVQRFRYPNQEFEVSEGDKPKMQDKKIFGEIVWAHDPQEQTLEILVGPSKQALHPSALFVQNIIPTLNLERALLALGRAAVESRGVARLPSGPQRALLMRETPRLRSGPFRPPTDEKGADVTAYAVQIVTELEKAVLPIQGPPGAGKTFTGARMILAAVQAGLRVGVTATSHKVISNLLKKVVEESDADRPSIGHKVSGDVSAVRGVRQFQDNSQAEGALAGRSVQVLGGTPWLWARPEFAQSVDLLFVDEAGQVSLANALAVAHAADTLVLLGDPQQLEQPTKGSHPDGAGLSALQHVLGEEETMPPDRGLFLPVTWRMAPTICRFTSELFYAGKLRSKEGLENQGLVGGPYQGNGLWLHEIAHEGNTNSSEEEVEEVARIVASLLTKGVERVDQDGLRHSMTPTDIRVVAPFNAQVNKIHQRLERVGHGAVPTGTVDMFQGQEAAVVIYSLASSRAEDAPRGMEFLYSLNRLNVATSRARCVVIVVGSSALFEPDCQTPRQMRLANALCRYRELAQMFV